jgi:hypothetical protein
LIGAVFLSTYIDILRGLLNVGERDSTILLDDHRESVAALRNASVPAMGLVEERLGIAHEQDLAIGLDSVDFTPTANT